jgi:hypothetical protein
MGEWSRAKFCDVVNLFLGTILFFSPWLFSLSLGTPRQTAAIEHAILAGGDEFFPPAPHIASTWTGPGGLPAASRRMVR